jgi:hypothetical protein
MTKSEFPIETMSKETGIPVTQIKETLGISLQEELSKITRVKEAAMLYQSSSNPDVRQVVFKKLEQLILEKVPKLTGINQAYQLNQYIPEESETKKLFYAKVEELTQEQLKKLKTARQANALYQNISFLDKVTWQAGGLTVRSISETGKPVAKKLAELVLKEFQTIESVSEAFTLRYYIDIDPKFIETEKFDFSPFYKKYEKLVLMEVPKLNTVEEARFLYQNYKGGVESTKKLILDQWEKLIVKTILGFTRITQTTYFPSLIPYHKSFSKQSIDLLVTQVEVLITKEIDQLTTSGEAKELFLSLPKIDPNNIPTKKKPFQEMEKVILRKWISFLVSTVEAKQLYKNHCMRELSPSDFSDEIEMFFEKWATLVTTPHEAKLLYGKTRPNSKAREVLIEKWAEFYGWKK